MKMTKDQLELYNKYIGQNKTYMKYFEEAPANRITCVDIGFIENGIAYLKKHTLELNHFIYETKSFYTYTTKEQDMFIEILMQYKKLLNRYELEKRRRTSSIDYNRKLLSKQTQYDYVYNDGGLRKGGMQGGYIRGVTI